MIYLPPTIIRFLLTVDLSAYLLDEDKIYFSLNILPLLRYPNISFMKIKEFSSYASRRKIIFKRIL